MIPLVTVRSFFWFLATLFLVFSFPMQVYAKSPYPSLFSYCLVMVIVLLSLFSRTRTIALGTESRSINWIGTMVSIYIILLLFNTSWQSALGLISIYEGASALTIYLLPTIWYWYFRRIGSEKEIRYVLIAMFVAGFIVGGYFAYDSYLKSVLGKVNSYAFAAFQYSLDRSGLTSEAVSHSRINPSLRSMGLLESHSVSGAWTILGCFAALTLIPNYRKIIRFFVIVTSGILLFLGNNFTAIIAFIIIMFLFEFGGWALIRGKITRESRGKLITLVPLIGFIIAILLLAVDDRMLEYLLFTSSLQIGLLLGSEAIFNNLSYFDIIIYNVNSYLLHVAEFPTTLILGDGFSTFGLMKGGDIGVIESLAKFGLPFFLIILVGFLRFIITGARKINVKRIIISKNLEWESIIKFTIFVMLLVLITECHYTIWSAKSILPIVFFALGLYERYIKLPMNVLYK